MFERYTEKARRVIFFARYEASQFGASAIEAEHILLGLLREDRALVNRFFPRPQGSIESIRKEIEGRTIVREKISTSVDLPLSPAAKRALSHAQEESERLQHRYIGTEHLLLGLLREEKSLAAEILRERGVRLDRVRNELRRPSDDATSEKVPVREARDLTTLASASLLVLGYASEECERLGGGRVQPEHLLIGLLREGSSRAAELLAARGATLDEVRRAMGESEEGDA